MCRAFPDLSSGEYEADIDERVTVYYEYVRFAIKRPSVISSWLLYKFVNIALSMLATIVAVIEP